MSFLRLNSTMNHRLVFIRYYIYPEVSIYAYFLGMLIFGVCLFLGYAYFWVNIVIHLCGKNNMTKSCIFKSLILNGRRSNTLSTKGATHLRVLFKIIKATSTPLFSNIVAYLFQAIALEQNCFWPKVKTKNNMSYQLISIIQQNCFKGVCWWP